jgi:DNA-binding phage protein
MKTYRTFDQLEEQYLLDHPDELDDYVTTIFEEYAETDDVETLFNSLQTVSRVKGINKQATLESHNPPFSSINSMMHKMGYRLTAQKISSCSVY